jgi:2-polyprenyl-3-methyl-5-hydroxy-6-metoxy-1,4-benzoquinol methylase
MSDTWTDRWNDRYSSAEFAYGEEPNHYFKEQLKKLDVGALLLPAEGEGRNAVYAARLGWTVSAFDISTEGKKKALQLAAANQVTIDYQVGELSSLHYHPGQFDAIALIYAHFPAAVKSDCHRQLDHYLRKGGTLIFEAFSKKHLEYISRDEKMGGPRELDMLFSIEEIQSDFVNYEIIELLETEVDLNEGAFHKGKGSVIRFVGRKK